MPALSSSPTAVLVDDSDPELGELGQVPAAPPGLLECLQKVKDPRKRRGVRHPITGVLAVALSATLAGAESFLAIAEWAADAGPGELTALGLRSVVPCESRHLFTSHPSRRRNASRGYPEGGRTGRAIRVHESRRSG